MRGNFSFHAGLDFTKLTTRVASFWAASLAVLRAVTASVNCVLVLATSLLAESTVTMKAVKFITFSEMSGGVKVGVKPVMALSRACPFFVRSMNDDSEFGIVLGWLCLVCVERGEIGREKEGVYQRTAVRLGLPKNWSGLPKNRNGLPKN